METGCQPRYKRALTGSQDDRRDSHRHHSGIAQRLGVANVPHTRRMACEIIASALVFRDRIAGVQKEIRSLAPVGADGEDNPPGEVQAAR